MKKKLRFVLLAMLPILVFLAACGQGEEENTTTGGNDEQEEQQDVEEEGSELGPKEVEIPEGTKPIVTMEMENGGQVVMELYPEIAPISVNNFLSLIDEQFYDGLTFHRVIPGFMIQGGDPNGNGTGGPGYSIEGEFESNGIDNDLQHEEGILSMARSGDPNSAGSQFFIMVENAPHLDGDYAAFGKVIEGMDVVHEIVSVETGQNDLPIAGNEQIISSMTFEMITE
ncbi:peptidylprolyl isomerase [Alkalihalobacillus trypoxylicola]|uniref:Peptidyl-prolyl cis-trans isomerase n=1 Tax=Alkalihalobacillus trypoxylicola TaxID=519424 RepID=A0A162F2F0_9BACI|nr:peptidylprolyl isomerase [Alkalihalobacillus trypoxylicola]KYG34339.1 peptidylprolyl isomerase [Alkalihalobacillus trypoxylicola]GAF64771.1 cyclophilin type peptidyl-prolyl cis-trans isomerase [Bacillus sp. TS-2]